MSRNEYMLETPAKINLHLEVLGKRQDGYHEIETLFYPLAWLRDDVSLEILAPSTGKIEVECDDPSVPDGEENLCHKAAAKFAEAAGVEPSWRIGIRKRIPVAAGLGGGSSDAAATLRLLDAYVKRLEERELRGIAVSLGADVPFFLDPRPSIGRGLGDILEPVESNIELNILLVNPKFPVSAAWAYTHLDREVSLEATSLRESRLLEALRAGNPDLLPLEIRNDLAPALTRKFPLLQMLLDDLRSLGALTVGVSGSGPTVFAIFADSPSPLAMPNTHSASTADIQKDDPFDKSDSSEALARLAEKYGDSLILLMRNSD